MNLPGVHWCACHDDGPPDERGRCQTCLLPRRAPDLERDAWKLQEMKDRLREAGWRLAVANDYQQNGRLHHFQCWTRRRYPKIGESATGEGPDELAAVAVVIAQVFPKGR